MRWLLLAGIAMLPLVGCQGAGWPFGPAPEIDTGATRCDEPETCIDRGCGTICEEPGDCPSGLMCLRFFGVDRGFCTVFCDPESEQDCCGADWRCVTLESVGGNGVPACVEPCTRNRHCDIPGWRCTGSWHCVPP